MLFSVIVLIVVLAGSASRWVAYRERVIMPRRFRVGSFRWWFPPFPSDGEFATPRSHRLEVNGRILINIAAALLAARLLSDMLSVG